MGSRIKLLLIVAIFSLVQGCSSISYYWEKVQGHSEILNNQRPIKEVIADSKTKLETRQRLINAEKARNFASQVLKLPDNDSYKNYVDIDRDYVVWTVVATPAYSIKPKQWCFLIVGCLSYRGYFSKQSAEEFAADLKKKNMDVYISGTKAYSTLGWFDDPLLSSMLYKSEANLVGIIFHELAHQQMYVEDDTAFNEGFASTVELLGIKAWFEQMNNKKGYAEYQLAKQRDKEFKQLLNKTRLKLKALYELSLTNEKKRQEKKLLFVKLKNDYAALKKQWNGYGGYDAWMSKDLNNAHLALVATYNDWIPAFKALFKKLNYQFKDFYKEVQVLADKPKQQRENSLLQLME